MGKKYPVFLKGFNWGFEAEKISWTLMPVTFVLALISMYYGFIYTEVDREKIIKNLTE